MFDLALLKRLVVFVFLAVLVSSCSFLADEEPPVAETDTDEPVIQTEIDTPLDENAVDGSESTTTSTVAGDEAEVGSGDLESTGGQPAEAPSGGQEATGSSDPQAPATGNPPPEVPPVQPSTPPSASDIEAAFQSGWDSLTAEEQAQLCLILAGVSPAVAVELLISQGSGLISFDDTPENRAEAERVIAVAQAEYC